MLGRPAGNGTRNTGEGDCLMMMRLGDLLVERGVLSAAQRDAVLEQQRMSGRPFGLLSEEMHGVDPRDVELAWAAQYAGMAERIDVSEVSPTRDVLAVIETRQAWQFGLLPVRFEDGELILATTEDRLARALRFAGWRISFPCRFAIASEDPLMEAIERHLPMAGLNARSMRTLRLAVDL